jgi:starch synthase (maltosyl-transferring)
MGAPRGGDGVAGLRIAYGAPGADGAAGLFARAKGLGFNHVMVPPPWCGAGGDEWLSLGFDRLCPAYGDDSLHGVAGLAGAAGLGVVLDVVLDRVAAGSALADSAGSPFWTPGQEVLLDPRRSLGARAARARLEGVGDAQALAAWWAPHLAGWHGAGVAGFRLLGLAEMGASTRAALLTGLRQAVPAALLLPWGPRLGMEIIQGLPDGTVDAVFWPEAGGAAGVPGLATPSVAILGVDGGPGGAGEPGGRGRMALAATLGQGWLHVLGAPGAADMQVRALNATLAAWPVFSAPTRPALPLGDGGPVVALLRTDAADPRAARLAGIIVANTDGARGARVSGAALLPAVCGRFGALIEPGSRDALSPADELVLAPGAARVFVAEASEAVPLAGPVAREAAAEAARGTRLSIEALSPAVDGGAFPVKAIAGELVSVEADIVFDGHDKIAAALCWQGPDGAQWHEVPMRLRDNDRWQAALPLRALGRHYYLVRAWKDRFETFRDELAKKAAAGVAVRLELMEGAALVEAALGRVTGSLAASLADIMSPWVELDEAARIALLLSSELARLMRAADERPFCVQSARVPVDAERIGARFASWYEVFPRSMSDDPARHGNFADVERHLPRIRDMGFDVLYFPPISPIGRTNRKGRNNTLTPSADDPGSPYAIGAAEGGHDALHPQLGTLADFARLRAAASAHGLELAIDFAIQCSPDHPWLKQHPGWFDWRPDGSIRYAENPPKKYEDIVNVDFYAADAVPDLWVALCDVVLFWAEQGIRLFRVDNPHTKPLPFWEWMIGEVRARYPDAIFLAEAFTRPKVMYRLAKLGFSQSYTYFTWRNTKRELEDYLTELSTEAPKDFFRPHFFVNTPDINPLFLQGSGRPGFLIRAALAATLSGLWGVYNGFELCESQAVAGREEYADSEKYQIRAWDWERPGNIIAEITALNRIRRANPALQSHRGVTFHTAYNDAILFYEKATPDRSNVVLVAVSLDPRQAQDATIELPLWLWKLPDDASLIVEDLAGGGTFDWHGKMQHVRLTLERPYAIWRVRPALEGV